MEIEAPVLLRYITAFFFAWVVGVVTGFVWSWFRSLIGVGSDV